MYIWATMNSADQGVFPMDTAFKRRWNFEYIGINENEKEVENYEIPLTTNVSVNWNLLRKAINKKLIDLKINEDKLLGPFFLSDATLKNAINDKENFIKLFKSKVIMYLFEDVIKMKLHDFFVLDKDKPYIYSEICTEFDVNPCSVFGIKESDVSKKENSSTEVEDSITKQDK